MNQNSYSEGGYQNAGFHGKLPSAPNMDDEFRDYPVPSYDQATAPINRMNQPTYQTIPVIQTQVILVGGCPACRVGVLEDGM